MSDHMWPPGDIPYDESGKSSVRFQLGPTDNYFQDKMKVKSNKTLPAGSVHMEFGEDQSSSL